MNDINFTTISGRVSNVEHRTAGEHQLMDIFLDSTHSRKDSQPEVTKLKVTLWDKQAVYWSEKGSGHLKPGDSINVTGSLVMDLNKLKLGHVQSLSVINRVNEAVEVLDNTEDSVVLD